MRLTQQTCTLAQRLQRIAAHSSAHADGLVITAELTALEHHLEVLIDIVQLSALNARTKDLPALALKKTPRRQSTDMTHTVPVQQFDLQGLPR